MGSCLVSRASDCLVRHNSGQHLEMDRLVNDYVLGGSARDLE